MTPRAHKTLQLFPVVLSVVLMAATLLRFDGFRLFAAVRLGPVLTALLISLTANLFLSAFHFHQVLRACGEPAKLWNVTKLWIAALPIATFVPFQLGHLALIAGLKAQRSVSIGDAAQLVLVDKLYSLAGLAIVIATGVWFLDAEGGVDRVLITLGALVGPAVLLFEAQLRRWASQRAAFAGFTEHLGPCFSFPRRVWLLLLGTLRQSSEWMVFYCGLRAFGVDIDHVTAALAYPPVQFLSALPASISGFGVRENLIPLLIQCVDNTQGVALGLFVDGIEYVVPALVALLFVPYLSKLLANFDRPSTSA